MRQPLQARLLSCISRCQRHHFTKRSSRFISRLRSNHFKLTQVGIQYKKALLCSRKETLFYSVLLVKIVKYRFLLLTSIFICVIITIATQLNRANFYASVHFTYGKNAFSAFSRSQEFAKKLCSNNRRVCFSVRQLRLAHFFIFRRQYGKVR